MWAALGLDLWECLTLRFNFFSRHKNMPIFQFLSLRLWEVVIFLKSVDNFLHVILQFMPFSVSVICAFSIFLRKSFVDLLILSVSSKHQLFLRLPSLLNACILNLCSAVSLLCPSIFFGADFLSRVLFFAACLRLIIFLSHLKI